MNTIVARVLRVKRFKQAYLWTDITAAREGTGELWKREGVRDDPCLPCIGSLTQSQMTSIEGNLFVWWDDETYDKHYNEWVDQAVALHRLLRWKGWAPWPEKVESTEYWRSFALVP